MGPICASDKPIFFGGVLKKLRGSSSRKTGATRPEWVLLAVITSLEGLGFIWVLSENSGYLTLGSL